METGTYDDFKIVIRTGFKIGLPKRPLVLGQNRYRYDLMINFLIEKIKQF
jgi:hypothetical protein